mmetsp:Transcript_3043/g.7060  ORF Transcript_3043/g.7060 Transcript_3043/m.7060 type:complete len:673 (-) Transcript_3043:580-2598(-)
MPCTSKKTETPHSTPLRVDRRGDDVLSVQRAQPRVSRVVPRRFLEQGVRAEVQPVLRDVQQAVGDALRRRVDRFRRARLRARQLVLVLLASRFVRARGFEQNLAGLCVLNAKQHDLDHAFHAAAVLLQMPLPAGELLGHLIQSLGAVRTVLGRVTLAFFELRAQCVLVDLHGGGDQRRHLVVGFLSRDLDLLAGNLLRVQPLPSLHLVLVALCHEGLPVLSSDRGDLARLHVEGLHRPLHYVLPIHRDHARVGRRIFLHFDDLLFRVVKRHARFVDVQPLHQYAFRRGLHVLVRPLLGTRQPPRVVLPPVGEFLLRLDQNLGAVLDAEEHELDDAHNLVRAKTTGDVVHNAALAVRNLLAELGERLRFPRAVVRGFDVRLLQVRFQRLGRPDELLGVFVVLLGAGDFVQGSGVLRLEPRVVDGFASLQTLRLEVHNLDLAGGTFLFRVHLCHFFPSQRHGLRHVFARHHGVAVSVRRGGRGRLVVVALRSAGLRAELPHQPGVLQRAADGNPLLRVFAQHLGDQVLAVARRTLRDLRLLLADLPLVPERERCIDQSVHHDAAGPGVGRKRVPPPAKLGGPEHPRSGELAQNFALLVRDRGAEVGDDELAVGIVDIRPIHQYVVALDVTVQIPLLVDVLDRGKHLVAQARADELGDFSFLFKVELQAVHQVSA